jgi:hypothetical protein
MARLLACLALCAWQMEGKAGHSHQDRGGSTTCKKQNQWHTEKGQGRQQTEEEGRPQPPRQRREHNTTKKESQ